MGIKYHKSNFLMEPGLHWAYARRGGYVALREDRGWRYISGVIIATGNGVLFLYFRRSLV